MDLTLKTDYGILLAAIAVVISAALSFFYYKGGQAQGKTLRGVLTSLRFLTILSVLLLFMSPVLTYLGSTSGKPIDIILIDRSESTGLAGTETVNAEIDDFLSNSKLENPKFFYFSGELENEVSAGDAAIRPGDSLGSKTNLSKALSQLKERLPGENISSVTVISDGIINDGGSPVKSGLAIGAPINYLLIGDTTESKDISIARVLYNKTAFIESSVPVSVELISRGHSGKTRVSLYEDGRLADTKELQLTEGQSSYTVDFSTGSSEKKIVQYKVVADSLEGEVTLRNNSSDFFIKYIDNRFKILVIAGGPSSDLAFIKEEMLRIKNFETDFRTQKSPGEFYEGGFPSSLDYDAVMLIGFPTNTSDESVLNLLRAGIEKRNLPVVFFASRNTDYSRLKLIEDRLPFLTSGFSETESETSLSPVSGISSRFFKNDELLSRIASFPSVFRTGTSISGKPDAVTILIALNGKSPALLISETSFRPSAAFLAHGLYKWKLGRNTSSAGEVLGYLLANIFSAISAREEGKFLSVETTSPVYSASEEITMTGTVRGFDASGGEKIEVTVKGNGYSKNFSMIKNSQGVFNLSFVNPGQGVFDFEAALVSQGKQAEKVSGRFLVGDNNYEFLETKQSNLLLNEVAIATGGKNVTDNQDNFPRSESVTAEMKSQKSFDLNLNPYFLSLIILFLSAEWFLRKRNNLP